MHTIGRGLEEAPILRQGLGVTWMLAVVGAMGSRRTHAERIVRLEEAGVDAASLLRIRAPIGLDIGARTPEETAVSICSEIIAQRTGRHDARPLRDTEGPIHGGDTEPLVGG